MVADCTFHLVAKTTYRMWGHRKVAVEVSPGTLSLGLWGRETQALGQRSVGCVSTFWTKAFADRYLSSQGFPDSLVGKGSACNAGDPSLIPGPGRFTGKGISSPLQYSGLVNSMDCIVHGVAKSQTGLSDFHFHFLLFISHLIPLLSKDNFF